MTPPIHSSLVLGEVSTSVVYPVLRDGAAGGATKFRKLSCGHEPRSRYRRGMTCSNRKPYLAVTASIFVAACGSSGGNVPDGRQPIDAPSVTVDAAPPADALFHGTFTVNVTVGGQPAIGAVVLIDDTTPPQTQATTDDSGQAVVTVDGTTYPLEPPFLVMATQNPVESEGTYNLPEAQLDRFMFKLVVQYPSVQEEDAILKLHCRKDFLEQAVNTQVGTLLDAAKIGRIQSLCHNVHVDEKILSYINSIVRKTREWSAFYLGASPRAGIAILSAARVQAAFAGRSYVVPDDIIELVIPSLRHRVILSPESEVEGETAEHSLRSLLKTIEVPRL